jgi:hypothetical protein
MQCQQVNCWITAIMEMQLQPNAWSCLPTAFGMALDVPCKTIWDMCGHDGSEIIDEGLEDPFRRRGFHIQEMITCALALIVYPVELQVKPVIQYPNHEEELDYAEYINHMLKQRPGVLVGLTEQGTRHAVAWDTKMIFDPRGQKYKINNFNLETFYCFF